MLMLLDIYPAGEKPIEGVSSDGLYEKILQSGYKNAVRAQSKDEAATRVLSQAQGERRRSHPGRGRCLEDRGRDSEKAERGITRKNEDPGDKRYIVR